MDVDVTVYWRPGCGFCSMLRHKLKRTDLTYREVDIWSDPSAAAIERSYANGNETVPTVVIGQPGSPGSVGLVNPSARKVRAAVESHGGDSS